MVSLAGLWPCGGKSGIPVLFKIASVHSVSVPQGGCGISYALTEHPMPCFSSLGKKEETITKPLLQSPRSCMLMPQVSKVKGNQFEGGGGKSTGSYRLGWHKCPDLNHEGIWETEEKHSCLCGTEEHPGIVTQQWVGLADRASNPNLPDSWIYGSPNHVGAHQLSCSITVV